MERVWGQPGLHETLETIFSLPYPHTEHFSSTPPPGLSLLLHIPPCLWYRRLWLAGILWPDYSDPVEEHPSHKARFHSPFLARGMLGLTEFYGNKCWGSWECKELQVTCLRWLLPLSTWLPSKKNVFCRFWVKNKSMFNTPITWCFEGHELLHFFFLCDSTLHLLGDITLSTFQGRNQSLN